MLRRAVLLALGGTKTLNLVGAIAHRQDVRGRQDRGERDREREERRRGADGDGRRCMADAITSRVPASEAHELAEIRRGSSLRARRTWSRSKQWNSGMFRSGTAHCSTVSIGMARRAVLPEFVGRGIGLLCGDGIALNLRLSAPALFALASFDPRTSWRSFAQHNAASTAAARSTPCRWLYGNLSMRRIRCQRSLLQPGGAPAANGRPSAGLQRRHVDRQARRLRQGAAVARRRQRRNQPASRRPPGDHQPRRPAATVFAGDFSTLQPTWQ